MLDQNNYKSCRLSLEGMKEESCKLIQSYYWPCIAQYFDSHFPLVYFIRLKHISARQILQFSLQMRHSARQSDNKCNSLLFTNTRTIS